MTLEDWFDPRRLKDDYAPTGFRGQADPLSAGSFGLDLSAEDRMIAFLRTL